MKHLALALALCASLPASTSAQDSTPILDAPRLLRLARGDRAPSDGILAPEDLFVDWRTRIVILESQLRIESEAAASRLEVAERLCSQRLTLATARTDLVSNLYRDRVTQLAEELRDAQHEDVTDSPLLWYFLGVATVVVLGVAGGLITLAATQ